MDSRVRLNFTGTAAGGAFAKARIRMYEGQMGDMDTDIGQINAVNQNNIWVDIAYMGIPFGDNYTLEMGKFRDTWGPLPTTYNFFYDDVNRDRRPHDHQGRQLHDRPHCRYGWMNPRITTQPLVQVQVFPLGERYR